MLISIVIPTYNVAPYVVECLDSVAAQTYRGKIECIIVDDCSTDDTREVINDWFINYRGGITFRFINLPKNGGLANARNEGMKFVNGDYLLFIDSDDAISPDCLEILTTPIHLHPRVDLVYGGMMVMGGPPVIQENLPLYTTDRHWLIRETMFCGGYLRPSAWGKLIKFSLLTSHDIKFIEGIIHEDVSFSCQISQFATSASFCPQPIYYYRTHRQGSIITLAPKNQDYAFRSRIILTQFLVSHVTGFASNLQRKSLLNRCVHYLRITDAETIDRYRNERRKLEKSLVAQLSFPWSLMAEWYFTLPTKLKKKRFISSIILKTTRI